MYGPCNLHINRGDSNPDEDEEENFIDDRITLIPLDK